MGSSRRFAFERRTLLKLGPAAVLSWLACSKPDLLRDSAGTAGAPQPVTTREGLADIGALAQRFRSASQGEAFDSAGEAIRAGLSLDGLLAAVFLAGVHDIRPQPVGGLLHTVMVVASVFDLAEAMSPEEGFRLALWNLGDFKQRQDEDRDRGDWVLPARPEVKPTGREEAIREFLAAMEAWDGDRADRAVVGLLPHVDHAAFFELIWPLAMRSYVNIGHKLIYAVQMERTLRRIGWQHAEPAVRSLVSALLFAGATEGRQNSAFERSVGLAQKLPDHWLSGKEEPDRSAELLRGLRRSDPTSAQDLVVAAFRDGLGPATVWDGLRLYASEMFLRRSRSRPAEDVRALLPVHAVTVSNSMAHAWQASRNDSTRRVVVLQAAAWLTQLDRDLERIAGLSPRNGGTDILAGPTGEAPARLQDLTAEATPARALAFLEREPGQASKYLGHLRGCLARKAVEHHQPKYAAAMIAESTLAHKKWAPRILAAAVPYLPTTADPDNDVTEQIDRVLKQVN